MNPIFRDLHTTTDLAQRLQEGDVELASMLMGRCGVGMGSEFAYSDGISRGDVSLLGLALSASTPALLTAVEGHYSQNNVTEPRLVWLMEAAGSEDIRSSAWRDSTPGRSARSALEYAFRSARPEALQWVLDREGELGSPRLPLSPGRILNLLGCTLKRPYTLDHVRLLQVRFCWTEAQWLSVEWGPEHHKRSFGFSDLAHAPVPVALSMDPALNPASVVHWWVNEAGGTPDLMVGWEGCPQESWVAAACRLKRWVLADALIEAGAVPHSELEAQLRQAQEEARQEAAFDGRGQDQVEMLALLNGLALKLEIPSTARPAAVSRPRL